MIFAPALTMNYSRYISSSIDCSWLFRSLFKFKNTIIVCVLLDFLFSVISENRNVWLDTSLGEYASWNVWRWEIIQDMTYLKRSFPLSFL